MFADFRTIAHAISGSFLPTAILAASASTSLRPLASEFPNSNSGVGLAGTMANARGGASSFTPSTVSSQSGVLMVRRVID